MDNNTPVTINDTIPVISKKRWYNNKTWIYRLLLALSAVALMSGYFLESRVPLLSHILRDIGISGLVGYILANTFERLSAEELKEERIASANEFRRLTEDERAAIKKDVFFYVLGHDLPEAIRTEIDTQILKSVLIREHMKLFYELETITAPDTGEEYMKSTCTMSYTIKNLTKTPQLFKLNSSIDTSPIASLAPYVKFIRLSVKGSEAPYECNEAELKRLSVQKDTEIVLQPATIDPKREIYVRSDRETKVEIKNQTIRFLRRGHLDFMFTHHTCKLDLIVKVRSPNLKVFASPSAEVKLEEVDVEHDPERGDYRWEINRPLIASQSINITWTVEPPAGSPADTTLLLERGAGTPDSSLPATAAGGTNQPIAAPTTVNTAGNPMPGREEVAVAESR